MSNLSNNLKIEELFRRNNVLQLIRPRNLISLLTGLAIVALGYKTIKIYLKRRKYRHIPGPKTNGILGFYFGNLFEIRNLPTGKIFHDLLVDYVKLYGHVFKYQLFDRIIIMTVDPDTIRVIIISIHSNGLRQNPFEPNEPIYCQKKIT